MWGLRKSQNFVIFKKDTSTLFSASLEITVKFLKASVNSYTCPELVEGMDLKFFQDKKVTVMGLGLHGGGVGVAKFFANLGARVLVTDLKSKTKLAPSIKKLEDYDIEYVLGRHRLKDFKKADLIIKNPAVPFESKYLQWARRNNIPVDTDIGIFFEFCQVPIIGITGTKGKSTVATLIYTLLNKKYPDVILAGNIRTSVLGKLKDVKENTIVVLELSSWQLEGLTAHKTSPRLAVITNIMPDHMDRYKTFDDYIKDKSVIFKYQNKSDYLILNYDNKITRSLASKVKSRVYFYSLKRIKRLPSNFSIGCFVGKPARLAFGNSKAGGKTIYFGKRETKISPIDEIKILGEHNLSNLLAALTVAFLYKVPIIKIKEVIRGFEGVPYRLQKIGEINGILFYNDTTATTPEATIAALNSLKRPIVLIAGGAEKNLSFEELTETIAKKVKGLIFLKGKATPRLRKEVVATFSKKRRSVAVKEPDTMEKAVIEAFNLAQKGDIVLLSPACSSFGMFQHEFDRGEQFNKAVKNLSKVYQNGRKKASAS